MQPSKPHSFLLFLITILLLAALPSCVGMQASPIEGAEREQVLAKAEPIADSLFQGMRDHDYAAFSRDFDLPMQKAMNEAAFQKMMDTIYPVVGQYQSRQVAKVEKYGKYIAVTYTVRYALEDAVSWRLVLTQEEPMRVTGLWYDSPKLRAK
jgi:hypothetical protein